MKAHPLHSNFPDQSSARTWQAVRSNLAIKGLLQFSIRAIFVLLMLTAVQAAAQSRIAVHGLLQDRSGRGISGVQVALENNVTHGRLIATSGIHGEFELTQLKPGIYGVSVQARGYAQLQKSVMLTGGSAGGLNLRAQLWPDSTSGKHLQNAGAIEVRPANPIELMHRLKPSTPGKVAGATATHATNQSGVNTAADFSLYSQVIAPNPQPFGLNVSLTSGSNLTDNVLLGDGGFGPYDSRLPLTATNDGTGTTFISTDASGGGTDNYSSIATGFFVGATAKVYRFENNAWSLLRTDTVTGYTAVAGSNAPADHTITFAESGTPTKVGDVMWLELDAIPQVASPNNYDARFSNICLTWNNLQNGCWQKNALPPYTLDTTVPSDDAGGLSLKVSDANTGTAGISQYIYVGIETFDSFQAGHTYRADVWLKQAPGGDGTATFSLGDIGLSHTFTGITSDWQHFTWDFPAPTSVPSTYIEPSASLSFNTPGTMWVNRFQMYDTSFEPYSLNPLVQQAWTDYHPGTMRIWSGFNAGGNYAFQGFDEWIAPEIHAHNNPLIGNQYEAAGNTELLPTALKNAKTIGANPWLIVNMSYDPTEIAHMIEYLDAPEGVGYATKRPADHPGPYTDDFPVIYLEVGNEEWGTQQTPVNFAYGQWAQSYINSAKTLAGFDPKTSKLQWIVNGFFLQPSFGSAAIAQAPDAKWVDYAIYSGGDSSLSGDPYYQSDLLTMVSSNKVLIDNMVAQQQVDALSGHPYSLAAYESGPGQDTPTHQGDSSLAAGVGTLDVELYAALRGFGPENYFDYRLGAGPYTSHSEFKYGLLPHPAWLAFQMRNAYCHGPMTWTIANKVPVTNDSNQYPLIGVYTFHDTTEGKNNAEVVVISRDLNNTTPVTLHLPFTPTGSVTLYSLTGDPRGNNDTALNIPIATQSLSAVTKDYTFNMPPGSVYILDIPATGDWSNDTPVPSAPTNLQAVADNGKVSLLWGTVDGITNYNLKRSTTQGGPYTSIAQPTGPGYTDSGLVNGTTYYYVVSAVNNGGESLNSNEVAVTPNVDDSSYTSVPPTIDGSDSGPWSKVVAQTLTHNFNTHTPDTATFKTLWDKNYLYMLASVQDATPTVSDTVYYGDSVELYFSGTDSKSSAYGPTDFQFEFPYGGTTVSEFGHGATAGVKFGQQKVKGGYQMTIAIPWTTLGTVPVAGKQYGFDVMINDGISNDNRAGKLAWWGTQDLTYANPSLMGPLVLTENGNYIATSTSVSASPQSGLITGDPWTLTAVVSPTSGTKIPKGFVSFHVDGPYGGRKGAFVDATGKAVVELPAPGFGNYTVTAYFQGSGGFADSVSDAESTVVAGNPTSVVTTVGPDTNLVYGQPWTITAEVTSADKPVTEGYVEFFVDGVGPKRALVDKTGTAVYESTVVLLGSYNVRTTYYGVKDFASSTAAPVAISVTQTPTTTDFVLNPLSTLSAGAPYTVTAHVKSLNGASVQPGTVTITETGPVTKVSHVGLDKTGTANFAGYAPIAGNYTVTVSYGGSTQYLPSSAPPVTHSIVGTAKPTSVALTQQPATDSVTGQPWTLTAFVTAVAGNEIPQGTVTFYWKQGSATVPIDAKGQATYNGVLPVPGANSIQARYNASSEFARSASKTINFTVEGYGTTTTMTVTPEGAITTGQSITLRAQVKATTGTMIPSGSVAFSIGSTTQTATVDGTGVATVSGTANAVGTLTLQASYQGSAQFAGSSSNIVSENVTAATATHVPVSLVSSANMPGIWTDSTPVNTGMDGQGNAYSANVLGSSVTIAGITYNFGTPNENDVVNGAGGGPTIPLPAGNFSSLNFLGTGVYGSQTGQVFIVTYTDGTSQQFTQSLSDWFSPQTFAGETVAIKCPYRLLSSGAKDERPFYVYGYSFALDSTKQVKSVKLPDNWNDFILAATLKP